MQNSVPHFHPTPARTFPRHLHGPHTLSPTCRQGPEVLCQNNADAMQELLYERWDLAARDTALCGSCSHAMRVGYGSHTSSSKPSVLNGELSHQSRDIDKAGNASFQQTSRSFLNTHHGKHGCS
eukprot:Skav224648  [mRNA]  locus=scaffold4300:64254:67097:- [translate_table: standard]